MIIICNLFQFHGRPFPFPGPPHFLPNFKSERDVDGGELDVGRELDGEGEHDGGGGHDGEGEVDGGVGDLVVEDDGKELELSEG